MSSDGRMYVWSGVAWVQAKVSAAGRLLINAALGGGGGTGFIASVVKVGLTFANRFNLIATEVNPAVSVIETAKTVRIETLAPAIDTDLLGAVGVAAQPAQSPAVSVVSRIVSATVDKPTILAATDIDLLGASGTVKPAHTPAFDIDRLGAVGSASVAQASAISATPRISEYHLDDSPACKLVQVVYNLTRRVGGNAQAAVGTAWTTPDNAVGSNNGTVATSAGAALASTKGIELSYLNHILKGELAITSATLFVYAEVTGDTLGVFSTMTISYNIGAGVTTLEVIVGNFSNLVTPRVYALPLLNTWTEYDALQTRVIEVLSAASVGCTARLDAIEIEIVATLTEDPNP